MVTSRTRRPNGNLFLTIISWLGSKPLRIPITIKSKCELVPLNSGQASMYSESSYCLGNRGRSTVQLGSSLSKRRTYHGPLGFRAFSENSAWFETLLNTHEGKVHRFDLPFSRDDLERGVERQRCFAQGYRQYQIKISAIQFRSNTTNPSGVSVRRPIVRSTIFSRPRSTCSIYRRNGELFPPRI